MNHCWPPIARLSCFHCCPTPCLYPWTRPWTPCAHQGSSWSLWKRERERGTEGQKWQRARRSDREQEVSTEIYCKCKLTKREKWWRQMRDRDREWATEIDRESNHLLCGSPYPAPCCCQVAAFYYSWLYHNMQPHSVFVPLNKALNSLCTLR